MDIGIWKINEVKYWKFEDVKKWKVFKNLNFWNFETVKNWNSGEGTKLKSDQV